LAFFCIELPDGAAAALAFVCVDETDNLRVAHEAGKGIGCRAPTCVPRV